jgi:hypothetical protein
MLASHTLHTPRTPEPPETLKCPVWVPSSSLFIPNKEESPHTPHTLPGTFWMISRVQQLLDKRECVQPRAGLLRDEYGTGDRRRRAVHLAVQRHDREATLSIPIHAEPSVGDYHSELTTERARLTMRLAVSE